MNSTYYCLNSFFTISICSFKKLKSHFFLKNDSLSNSDVVILASGSTSKDLSKTAFSELEILSAFFISGFPFVDIKYKAKNQTFANLEINNKINIGYKKVLNDNS